MSSVPQGDVTGLMFRCLHHFFLSLEKVDNEANFASICRSDDDDRVSIRLAATSFGQRCYRQTFIKRDGTAPLKNQLTSLERRRQTFDDGRQMADGEPNDTTDGTRKQIVMPTLFFSKARASL
ncbi:unnamed protein product [Angiostrongylus costaricensis]|uniref:Uncharacterized protein n=1 Tax=Angiostrongylus costaricensis TaxID=334426 RepID=A0A158PDI0_ANGCS|nr:unnamed protein product [Angiostrongylus costaricensis]